LILYERRLINKHNLKRIFKWKKTSSLFFKNNKEKVENKRFNIKRRYILMKFVSEDPKMICQKNNTNMFCECFLCHQQFLCTLELIDHLFVHAYPDYLQCKFCKREFKQSRYLVRHLKNIHENWTALHLQIKKFQQNRSL
jgi:hypothetical protein